MFHDVKAWEPLRIFIAAFTPYADMAFMFGYSFFSATNRAHPPCSMSLCNRFIHSLKVTVRENFNTNLEIKDRNAPNDVADTAERVDGVSAQVVKYILTVVTEVTEATNSSR
jgi:hypothetical protein